MAADGGRFIRHVVLVRHVVFIRHVVLVRHVVLTENYLEESIIQHHIYPLTCWF